MLALFSTGCVELGSFDDEREGMLRKDRFFFGASAGFRTVCEEGSFEVGTELALDVGVSECAGVVSVGPGACKESEHGRVSKGARKADA